MDPQSVLAIAAALPEIWHFHHSGRESRLQEVGSRDGSAEESTVTGQSGGGRNNSGGGGGGGRRRSRGGSRRDSGALAGSEDESSRTDCDVKRNKVVESKDENEDSKPDLEGNCGDCSMPICQNVQPSEAPKQDFIHVRARRGQATDSHSLAERARREKISERMKMLQGLIPGCNKVIGKALVLDEIINYIQSLQRQVEFLSMKLEVFNSRMEEFPAKDVSEQMKHLNLVVDKIELPMGVEHRLLGLPYTCQVQFGVQTFDSSSGMALGSHPTREYGQGSPLEWLHMQIGSGFERAT